MNKFPPPRFENGLNQATRVKIEMNAPDALFAISEGNPGALTAAIKLMKKAKEIDPDSVWAEWGPIISFDTHGIYGPHIWCLWKDICGMDPVKVETLFRACQLGFMPHERLYEATRDRPGFNDPEAFDFAGLNAQVRERLPRFAALVA